MSVAPPALLHSLQGMSQKIRNPKALGEHRANLPFKAHPFALPLLGWCRHGYFPSTFMPDGSVMGYVPGPGKLLWFSVGVGRVPTSP